METHTYDGFIILIKNENSKINIFMFYNSQFTQEGKFLFFNGENFVHKTEIQPFIVVDTNINFNYFFMF